MDDIVAMSSADPSRYQRLIYQSRPTSDDRRADLDTILRQSRTNNGLNGISGLLWSDEETYLQILEGSPEAVGHIFDLISRDPRHEDIEILAYSTDDSRLFGHWEMAHFPFDDDDHPLRKRLVRLRKQAPKEVVAILDRALASVPSPARMQS